MRSGSDPIAKTQLELERSVSCMLVDELAGSQERSPGGLSSTKGLRHYTTTTLGEFLSSLYRMPRLLLIIQRQDLDPDLREILSYIGTHSHLREYVFDLGHDELFRNIVPQNQGEIRLGGPDQLE